MANPEPASQPSTVDDIDPASGRFSHLIPDSSDPAPHLDDVTPASPDFAAVIQALQEGTAPQRLGRYRVLARLGVGGFGVVFRDRDDELGRDVALKVPHRERVTAAQDVEAFLDEARILARLHHPGIVPVYDVGRTDDGLCYVVYQLVEGSDLRARLVKAIQAKGETPDLFSAWAREEDPSRSPP
jgi:eukaryotic-like serine/threonine-protein kinase